MEEDFFTKIKRFNDIYKLESNDKPTLLKIERLKNFKEIISEEINEVDEIISKYKEYLENKEEISKDKEIKVLTEISDWLGDIIVYTTSEARRFGIDMKETLNIIMESNFSKLDQNGNPIIDERGKVMKGPNYWKPEPRIESMLKEKFKLN